MNNKKKRALLLALIAIVVIIAIVWVIRNRDTDSGSGTLAFTTLADTTEPESVPDPGPDETVTESETEETEGSTEETTEAESPETEPASETPAPTTEIAEKTAKETPAPTTEETTVETTAGNTEPDNAVTENGITVTEDGEYTDKDHVALYLHAFGKLPSNYITKEEAEDLGWVSSLGNLWKVAPGKSIGGSHFGNYEKLLPTKKGRKYYECDIDYKGKSRGAKRIIYSNDGLIFYTEDHYESFEQLY